MKILATALALVASVGVASAASISTTGDYWRTLHVGGTVPADTEPSFGADDFGTYGQTFSVGSEGAVLTDFGMALNDVSPFIPVTFNAHVYMWNGTDVSGSSLFSASNLSTNGTGVTTLGFDNLSMLMISTGALALAGGEYVILIESTAGGPAGVGISGGPGKDAYADGYAVVVDDFLGEGNAGMFERKAYDATFVVNFSEVPLGASLPLLGTALAALGIATRRRRKA